MSSFGTYKLKKTAAGMNYSIRCEYPDNNSSLWRECDMFGHWTSINYSLCITKSEHLLTTIKSVSLINGHSGH